MRKVVRNVGHVHVLKPDETRQYVTSVDYAARTYEFPAGQDTTVEADVADYVSSIYAGQGLVIVDHAPDGPPPKTAEEYEAEIAALKAKQPESAPSPDPIIPKTPTRPAAGTEAIRLARDAASKKKEK